MPCIHVAVGSTNPCKLEAVRQAFQEAFSTVTINVMGYDVPSGVSNQPFGDYETKLGAKNRALAAFHAASVSTANSLAEQKPILPLDYAVGLEGGLILEEDQGKEKRELWCMAWMAVAKIQHENSSSLDDQLRWGYAKTASFLLPHEITQLVLDENMELGTVK